MNVGDRVMCRCKGSWCDAREAVVERLNVWSGSDQVFGHQVRIAGHGVVVLEEWELEAMPVVQR